MRLAHGFVGGPPRDFLLVTGKKQEERGRRRPTRARKALDYPLLCEKTSRRARANNRPHNRKIIRAYQGDNRSVKVSPGAAKKHTCRASVMQALHGTDAGWPPARIAECSSFSGSGGEFALRSPICCELPWRVTHSPSRENEIGGGDASIIRRFGFVKRRYIYADQCRIE
jgi:hypothetical protein